jgi:hypothetical protein
MLCKRGDRNLTLPSILVRMAMANTTQVRQCRIAKAGITIYPSGKQFKKV